MRSLRGGGPVVLQVGPSLVPDVFRALGFLDAADADVASNEDELDEALSAFISVNGRRLSKDHGVQLDVAGTTPLAVQLHKLHELFAAQGSQQRWRIMLSDAEVRRKLQSSGLIADGSIAREDMLVGMRQYMLQRGFVGGDQLLYRGAVLQCAALINSKNPESRT